MNQKNSSASSLKISSYNANSVGKNPKREQVLNFLKNKNMDIYVLLDTRFDKNIETSIKNQWGGEVIFSSKDSQSRGVAIFFRKNLPIEILDQFLDDTGNILSVKFKFDSRTIMLTGIYGPNTDSPGFYETKCFPLIDRFEPDFSIFCGDWNFTLNQDLDNHNYMHVNNPRAKSTVIECMETYNLCDIYRDLNPLSKTYTWHKRDPLKMARLDFFLISDHLSPFVLKSKVSPGFKSDHSLVSLEIDFSKVQLGRGFFKFNNSLLRDQDYVNLVKKTITNVTRQYSVVNFAEAFWDTLDNINIDNLEVNINDQLYFEVLLMEIRGATIQYSARKKRQKTENLVLLLHNLEKNELELNTNPDKAELLINIDLIRTELESIYKNEAEGIAIRSRAKYNLDSEKATTSFCNLEKINACQKYISRLKVKSGDEEINLDSQTEIETEMLKYYRDLYSNKDHLLDDINIENFLGETKESIPKLNEEQKLSMEGLITEQEILKYLKQLRNNKSPGSSGFTGEFYKFFWVNFKNRLTKSINYSFESGSLPKSQQIGVLTLIPKGKKDKVYLKNWRPLTMLCTYYKIVSGCITERMKPNLDLIISTNQKAYLPNRYIGEITRTTFDLFHVAKKDNIPGILLLIDFEKCFDSVSHKYIQKCLGFFNFGEDIKKWINILTKDFYSCINHVGNISERFLLGRGVKQGDPISGYLFLLCAEVLAHRIKYDKNVFGFKIGTKTNILEQYADDLKIFLKVFNDNFQTEENIKNTIKILDEFYKISGLKANIDKTFSVWFGSKSDCNEKLCPDLGMTWVKSFEALGIKFDNELRNMNVNLTEAMTKVKTTLKSWKNRFLTPYGKITVIKTLILSKLTHLVLIIPTLTSGVLNEIEVYIYDFLWNSKPNQIAKKFAVLPEKNGGINMISIPEFWKALKISWLRRMITSESYWLHILKFELSKFNLAPEGIFLSGNTSLSKNASKISNPFWIETFRAGAELIETSFFSQPKNFSLFPLIENSLFKINNQNITTNFFRGLKTLQVSDIMCENTTSFKNLQQFNIRQNLNLNFLEFESLKHSIIMGARKLNHNIHNSFIHPEPRQPLLISLLTLQKKGCRTFYDFLMSKQFLQTNTGTIETKWHTELGYALSVNSWNLYYKMQAKIKFFNDIKWLQYRILHHSLKTNKVVSKFKNDVSLECTFCTISPETISHLFFSCPIVLQFWEAVKNLFLECNTNLNITCSKILFGDIAHNIEAPNNMLILFGKMFIWKQRYEKRLLNINAFKNYLLHTLKTLNVIYELKGNLIEFVQRWENILLLLNQEDEHLQQNGIELR